MSDHAMIQDSRAYKYPTAGFESICSIYIAADACIASKVYFKLNIIQLSKNNEKDCLTNKYRTQSIKSSIITCYKLTFINDIFRENTVKPIYLKIKTKQNHAQIHATKKAQTKLVNMHEQNNILAQTNK